MHSRAFFVDTEREASNRPVESYTCKEALVEDPPAYKSMDDVEVSRLWSYLDQGNINPAEKERLEVSLLGF